jgi:hypothetical protein
VRFAPIFAALALLAPAGAGAVPTTERGAISDATGGAPTDLAVSTDGRYIAVAEGSGGGLRVFDRLALSDGAVSPTVCTGASSVVYVNDSVAGERFFVGCPDGAVYAVDLDDSTIPPTLRVSSVIELNSGTGDVEFLVHAPGDSLVFALVQAAGTFSLHAITVGADGGDSDAIPLTVTGSLTIVAAAIGESGTPLVLARTDGLLNFYDRSGSSFNTGAVFPSIALGTLSDVAIRTSAAQVLVADNTGDEVWSFPTSGASLASSWAGGFPSPSAIEFALTDDDGLVVWVATDDSVLYAIDSSQVELADVSLGGSTPMAIGVADGLDEVFVAVADFTVRIITSVPVFDSVAANPTSVGEGEPLTFSFFAPGDVAWAVEIGGNGTQGSGTEVGSGDAEDGDTIEIVLSADDLPDEGSNRIFAYATDGGGTGVDSASVVLDTPPDVPGELTVSPGEGRLSIAWDATSESDIATYELYVSDTEILDDSLPRYEVYRTDGSFDSYPVELDAGDASTEQSYTVEGLENGRTYWFAVRAIDAGGQISPLTAWASGSPQETCGAAECANDPGCSCVGSIASGAEVRTGLGLVLGIFAIARRRRD